MIKGGKIWAQPPICKVPKPQYVFYSLPPCTWHLYENIKEQQSSNLYKNSWQSRPAFSIFTHIEAHVGEHVPFSRYSKPQILKYSNIQIFKYWTIQIFKTSNMKRAKTFSCCSQKHQPRLGSRGRWRRNLFLFHLNWDPSTKAKICFDN